MSANLEQLNYRGVIELLPSYYRGVFLATIALCVATPALAAEWKQFVSPDHSFTVSVPERMQSMNVDTTQGARAFYRCSDGGNTYVLNVTPLGDRAGGFDEFITGVEKGLRVRGGFVRSNKDIKGKGWTGKIIGTDLGAQKRSTTVVAVSGKPAVCYTLSVNLPEMDVDTRKFVDSFTVVNTTSRALIERPDGAVIDRPRSKSGGVLLTEDDIKAADNSGYSAPRRGRAFIDATSLGILLPIAVLILLTGIAFFRRFKRKS